MNNSFGTINDQLKSLNRRSTLLFIMIIRTDASKCINIIQGYYVIHLAWNNGCKDGPRYKELLPNELNGYFEWYYLNV